MNLNLKFISLLILSITLFAACNKKTKQATNNKAISNEELLDVNRILVQKDQAQISGFVKRNNWSMQETKTGLWYEILKDGEGDSIKNGMQVSLKYKISLLNGPELYNSATDGIKTFTSGKGNVESGLEQAILMLKKGSSARLIMPPHLAHGLTGDGARIPARAIIIYEIELLQ